MADPPKYLCTETDCAKTVTATKNMRYRTHKKPDGTPCPNSSQEIPPRETEAGPVPKGADPGVPEEGRDFVVCKRCGRTVKLTKLGYLDHHVKPADQSNGHENVRCMNSGTRWRKTEDVVPDLPESVPTGVSTELAPPAPMVAEDAVDASGGAPSPPSWNTPLEVGVKTVSGGSPRRISPTTSPRPELTGPYRPSPELTATSPSSLEWTEASDSFFLEVAHAILMDAIGWSEESVAAVSDRPDQSQVPAFDDMLFEERVKTKTRVLPMGDLAKELATKIKETFYAYSNRKTQDNRSAQTTLGPSEIGTPCDRRLAMALMNIPAVNPGGDGWAAFVGTCTHAGMAEVYTFADAGTGRYAVELPLKYPSVHVPRGTTDLLDRRDATVIDWKVMGIFSLKKFRAEGPSPTYRTQAHVYGLGAEKSGEKVRNVAIVGLPRAGASLDEMHVWTEKYDRKFAQAALDRVEKIANEVEHRKQFGLQAGRHIPIEIARTFEAADDCRYCPFHLPKDKEMQRGCPGK